ncbi:MAG: hypothetical protein V4501_03265 [Pseudomonadota bacterium]
MEDINFLRPYQKLIGLALIIAFCFIVSLPILQAGFYSDDITNSVIPGTITLYQQGFWGFVVLNMQTWLSSGRLFPLSVISSVAMFYFFPAVHDYQIVRSLFIWMSILSCAWLVKTLTKNFAAAMLFIFLMPLCWSVRNAPDPLTSFAIFLPLMVTFIAWTLIFYRYYQVTQKQKFLIFSIITFSCALCTYEIGSVAFFLLMTLMYCKPINNQSLRTEIKPYFILFSAYLIINLLLHFMSKQAYDGIQIHLTTQFFPAFIAQFTAALPLSYFLFAPHPIISITEVLNNYLWAMIYLLLAGTGIIYWLLHQLVLTKRSCVCFSIMALFLMMVPAFIMAINLKYQFILRLGIGYIPVYIQYTGMGFILLAGLGSLNLLPLSINTKRGIHLLLASVLSIVITLATLVNLATINHINDKYKFNRGLVENAARHGLLASLPDQSYLIENLLLWNSPDFYMLNAHKTLAGVIDVRDTHKLMVFDKHNKLSSHHKYFISSFHLPGSQFGYVLLGHAKWAQVKNLKNNMPLTKAIFMTDPQLFIAAGPASQRIEILQNLQQQLNLSPEVIKAIALLYEKNAQDWLVTPLPAGNYRLII